uniref:DUF4200 domain-containing protein n=1 Tax=Strongyloides venezuelensis TaxID=75913 RepID=A0A0K0G4M7_STRVS
MSIASTSSTISTSLTIHEKKNKVKSRSNIKTTSKDTKSQVVFPKIDTNVRKTINNDAIKRWGRAERRLTLISFPKILNGRKKKDKHQEKIDIYKEREDKFLKSLRNTKKLNVSLKDSDVYFNTFLPLYFDISKNTEILPPNQISSDEIGIDSKNYVNTFKQFYNNYKEIEKERKKYYDNYNVNVIRRRQFLSLQKKIEKNEGILKSFFDVGNNLQEKELINNFNQMTDQFATLTFKLCHSISIKESKKLNKKEKNNQGIVDYESELEKNVDRQLNDIEYQIKEVDKDINIISKLLNE